MFWSSFDISRTFYALAAILNFSAILHSKKGHKIFYFSSSSNHSKTIKLAFAAFASERCFCYKLAFIIEQTFFIFTTILDALKSAKTLFGKKIEIFMKKKSGL
jgi:hypothetical protein